MRLFGFEVTRPEEKDQSQNLPSFVSTENQEGAVTVTTGGSYGVAIDLDNSVRTEAELVTRYRDMALQPECDAAVDEIVNESISIDEETIVSIDLDDVKQSDNVKKAIREEFDNCLKILDFSKNAYDIYRRWYVDGRLYYHMVIDVKNIKDGIKEVRYIDPRKIRKVREITNQKLNTGTNISQFTVPKIVNEYYMYNEKGFNSVSKNAVGSQTSQSGTTGLRIAKDSILHIVSGLTDNQGNLVLSYLHKAIKALNQLRTLEDALVIYRLARAPERRIWYIDVGNLPKMKAEQYLRDIMVKHKNRLVYDAASGEVKNDTKFMTMLEDFWLPRREGGRGTEVTTLPGGQTLGQMDDVLYFQKKFLQTLSVPVSRLNSDALFSIGRATEVTRDELKFTRFIVRLRAKFSVLFAKMLEKQLVLKGIVNSEEWKNISNDIKFDFAKDNYFTELKDNEILEGRVNLARNLQDMAGKYYSHEWVRKNVLKQSDDDVETEDKQIQKENDSEEPRWLNPQIEQNIMMKQQMDMAAQQPQLPPGSDQQPQNNEDADKMNKIREAEIFVKQMKAKGNPANRSIADQSKYKAAVQLIAKNKDLIAQQGTGQQPQQGQQ